MQSVGGEPRLRKYSRENTELVLRLLALNGGNVRRTQRQLVAEGLKVPEGTINHWSRVTHVSRYAQIQEELQGEVARRMGARALEIAAKSMDATELAVCKAQTALENDELEPRDLGPTARNLSQVHANSVDKGRLLLDQPTEIKEFNMTEAINELKELLGTKPVAIEGEAAEVTD
jgi:hypothetical protein